MLSKVKRIKQKILIWRDIDDLNFSNNIIKINFNTWFWVVWLFLTIVSAFIINQYLLDFAIFCKLISVIFMCLHTFIYNYWKKRNIQIRSNQKIISYYNYK